MQFNTKKTKTDQKHLIKLRLHLIVRFHQWFEVIWIKEATLDMLKMDLNLADGMVLIFGQAHFLLNCI